MELLCFLGCSPERFFRGFFGSFFGDLREAGFGEFVAEGALDAFENLMEGSGGLSGFLAGEPGGVEEVAGVEGFVDFREGDLFGRASEFGTAAWTLVAFNEAGVVQHGKDAAHDDGVGLKPGSNGFRGVERCGLGSK